VAQAINPGILEILEGSFFLTLKDDMMLKKLKKINILTDSELSTIRKLKRILLF
jgi:hypothetical protein